MTIRFSRLRLALIATLALLAVAPTARAQSSRDWSVCFGSGVLSCTDLFLSTKPTVDAGGVRDGTFMSLVLRQRDRGIPTGLLSFNFEFDHGSTDQSDALHAIPTPIGGASGNTTSFGWNLGLVRSGSPSGIDYLFGYAEEDGFAQPSQTAAIGGCLAPSNVSYWIVGNVTCGSGQAFRLQWLTPGFFDADEVLQVGVDVLETDIRLQNYGNGTGYCRGPASGGAGVGFDGFDPSNAFPCEIGGAESLIATVPEPQTVVLFAGGLVILGGWRRRGARLRGSRLRRRAV